MNFIAKNKKIFLKCKDKIIFLFFSPLKFLRKYYKVFQEDYFDERKIDISNFYLNKKKEFDEDIFNRDPKVLILVNHYYNKNKKKADFFGKSLNQEYRIRKNIVKKVIGELKMIPNSDVKICGIKNFSLVKIDQDFSFINDPKFLVYETLEWMFGLIEEYDYFINIEDDILFTNENFQKIIQFDKKNDINKCFHPNRMEYDEDGNEYCVDFKAESGWKKFSMVYEGQKLRVAKNPHSGLAVFSKPKMLYIKECVNLKRRDRIIGYYMASAFANINSPFLLFRSYSDLSFHKVIHMDKWIEN